MNPSNILPVPADTRSPITGRDVSYHEAQAGIAAREAAAASGGDPAALRALVGAATLADASAPAPLGRVPMLLGHPLRRDDLLVSLCFALYARVFGVDPRQRLHVQAGPEKLAGYAELAFIFTQAETAWDLLDHAADDTLSGEDRAGWSRDFRRAAVEFAGGITRADIAAFNAHLAALARARPVGDDAPEDDAPEDDAGNV